MNNQPDSLELKALYDELYILNTSAGDSAQDPQVNINFIQGDISKGIWVFLNDHQYGEEEQKEFLKKVLKAVNLSTNDVAIASNQESRSGLQMAEKSGSKILLQFNSHFPNKEALFTTVNKNNLKAAVYPDLVDIMADNHLKRQLWSSLKAIFL